MDQQTRKKRPRRATRLRPSARRAQLLQCAIRAFADAGVSRAVHVDVARLAEVSVPTVFVYFPTRDALLEAVLEEVARFILDDVLAPIQSGPGDVPTRLVATALGFAAAVRTHPDHARVWLDWSTAIRDDVWPRYMEFQDRVLALLKKTVMRGRRDGTLQKSLDPDHATRLLVGTAHMLAQMTFMHYDQHQVEQFIRTLIDGFRNSATAAPRRRR